jgi:hypothetical protein
VSTIHTTAARLIALANRTGLDAIGEELRAIAGELLQPAPASPDQQQAFERHWVWRKAPSECDLSKKEDGTYAHEHVRRHFWTWQCAQAEKTAMHWTEKEPVRLAYHRMGRVYVAGPMTGLPDLNFTAFNAEAARLRADGLFVLNPAEHGVVVEAEWGDYLRHDIAGLVSCERIHFLPGWQGSKGARLEHAVAAWLGMLMTFAEGATATQPTPMISDEAIDKALADIDQIARGWDAHEYALPISFKDFTTPGGPGDVYKQMQGVIRNLVIPAAPTAIIPSYVPDDLQQLISDFGFARSNGPINCPVMMAAWRALINGINRYAEQCSGTANRLVPIEAVQEVERERDDWKAQAQTTGEFLKGVVWYWQGDAGDQLESMAASLPVLIRADDLRGLVAVPQPIAISMETAA